MVYSQAAISFKRAHLLFRPGDACLAPFADPRPEMGLKKYRYTFGKGSKSLISHFLVAEAMDHIPGYRSTVDPNISWGMMPMGVRENSLVRKQNKENGTDRDTTSYSNTSIVNIQFKQKMFLNTFLRL